MCRGLSESDGGRQDEDSGEAEGGTPQNFSIPSSL
jgi:hypothetical protein